MQHVKELLDEEWFSEEDNFYSEDLQETLLENDELEPFEAGFMKGWEDAGVEY